MKAEEKKAIRSILSRIKEFKSELETMKEKVQEVYDVLDVRFDEHPETWQESAKGEAATEEMGKVDDIITNLDDAWSNLEAVVETIEGGF